MCLVLHCFISGILAKDTGFFVVVVIVLLYFLLTLTVTADIGHLKFP